MTRGTLVLLTNDGKLFQSVEFNGDMYWDGNGEDAFKTMQNVETVAEFQKAVIDFNNTHHNYTQNQWIYKCDPKDDFLNGFGRLKYYDYWFSDYLYFKNASDDDIVTKDHDGKELIIKANEVTIINFGKLYLPSEDKAV